MRLCIENMYKGASRGLEDACACFLTKNRSDAYFARFKGNHCYEVLVVFKRRSSCLRNET